MIKLLDILEEGTLSLTPEERQQIEAIVPLAIENIRKEVPERGQVWDLGRINYKFADGEDGEVQIGLGDIVHFTGKPAGGVFMTYDYKNRKDNWIIVDQNQLKPYFPSGFTKFDQDLKRKFTGNENEGIEVLKQVLRHELIHAKDPALNHHYLKEPYNAADEKTYYGSWAEFQTMTGQFFESIIAGADRILNNATSPGDIKRIEKALSNILQYFAGKTPIINTETKDFINGTGSRNIFQRIFNFLDQVISRPGLDITRAYTLWISKIKQHNPEGYKEFLKDLYKTIKSIEEKVNNTSTTKIKVQEMKSSINEVKRMQHLAGLLTEVENPEQELKDILKADYPTFVQKLGDNINDPKFREAIKSIADKHPIKTTDISPKVAALKPTQNEIDVDKSLKFPLTNAQSAAICLKGGAVSIAGKNIVTGGGGKFIIDGHHRWSQLYCMNPEASITAMDVINITDPMSGLKATQLGIAGDIGKVPVAKVEGQNLLKMDKDALVAYVIKTVTPEVLEVFKKAGKGNDAKAVAEYVWKNVEQMQKNNQPVSGAPGRGIMPQTDDAVNWPNDAANPQAVKEIFRMQQLAGIINEEEQTIATPNSNKLDRGLDAGLNTLKSGIEDLEPATQKESLILTAVGLTAGAPGLVKLLGNVVDAIIKTTGFDYFAWSAGEKVGGEWGDKIKSTAKVGKNIAHWGHEQEEAYISFLKEALLKVAPDLADLKNKQKLEDLAKQLYAGILGSLAVASATEALNAKEILKIVQESGLASFKAVEATELSGIMTSIAKEAPNLKQAVQSAQALASEPIK
jgi:hypothetical protein